MDNHHTSSEEFPEDTELQSGANPTGTTKPEPREEAHSHDKVGDLNLAHTTDEILTQPESPLPAWKTHARKLYEEREEKKRKMIEERRKHEEASRASREAYETQIHHQKNLADEEIKENFERRLQGRKKNLDAMIERQRQEREKKRAEREAMDEQLRQLQSAKDYKTHKDISDRANRLSKKDE